MDSTNLTAGPIDRVARAFDAIERLDDPAIFLAVADREATLAAVDPTLPLAGLTVAVKNNIDVAGFDTTAACPSYGYRPTADATAVARLRQAGASIVGVTNLDQFATGLVGTRSPHGTPRNPIDDRLVPGGSSSGSAVAVARGLVDVALGTDTAGSGRVPAAQCGIVGAKPTPGRVPTTGVVPAVRSLDCVSIFARDVATTRRVLDVIEGDDGDAFARPVEPWPGTVRRIGVPVGDGLVLDGDLERNAWTATLDRLAATGVAEVVEVDVTPLLETGLLLYDGAWVAERHLAVGDHVAGGAADLDPVVAGIVRAAAELTAADAFAGIYELARLRRAAHEAWADVDLLVVPTTPGVASLAEVAADPVGRNSRLGVYTNGVNLLGWCGMAVPGVERADGWPFGVTVLGPPWADPAVADVAEALLSRQSPRAGSPTAGSRPSSTARPDGTSAPSPTR